jgi:hypothetical protein
MEAHVDLVALNLDDQQGNLAEDNDLLGACVRIGHRFPHFRQTKDEVGL